MTEHLTEAQAAYLFGIGKSTFHALRSEPWMPKPRVLGPKTVRWARAELVAAIEHMPRAEGRQEPPQLKRGRMALQQERKGVNEPDHTYEIQSGIPIPPPRGSLASEPLFATISQMGVGDSIVLSGRDRDIARKRFGTLGWGWCSRVTERKSGQWRVWRTS